MAYCAKADVERVAGGADALSQLTDLDGSGEFSQAVLDQAIAQASGWIDAYVGRQRHVPLADPVAEVVKRIAREETVYLLRCNKRGMAGDYDVKQHEANERFLVDVGKGLATLGVDPQPVKADLVYPAVVLADDLDTEITAENTKGMW